MAYLLGIATQEEIASIQELGYTVEEGPFKFLSK
jgi:hypothetical protein